MKQPTIPPEDLVLIERWCIQAVPESAEQELRLEARVRGNRVTVFERRPPWHPEERQPAEAEWVRIPRAQLRYAALAPAQLRWSLYWADRRDRWHLYEQPSFAPSPERLLAAMEDDVDGVFFG